ncbi:tripartite tricarboxylate transporter substrate binding protein [Pigmentiphaga sp.]|uniref:Bug family tripartite tricarboxylate transporter substrate binding protein n=1 Tax=Pigmentiphaga sp. TaxID=1977564 RepID=UPI0025E95BF8|nr:tripartite tricarboxylate transporter substrate binding protein [Pigmentiphaga sp.]
MLVGFPPGQATDIVARMLAEKLAVATGDTIIVENKPGQGGSLGLGALAKSPNDGSVMMLAHMSAVATNPHMYKSVAYDSTKDFQAIGLVGDLPFVLVSNPAVPVRNVAELIAYAKANPGKLTNASSGNGTVSHLAMEEFKRHAGVDIVHVPYQGSARGLTDVMAGTVSIALETAAATKPLVESGKLRVLGAGSAQRLDGVLDAPTLKEQGIPDFTAVTWLMLMYPAGVPKSLVDRGFEALRQVSGTQDFKDRLRTIGALPRSSRSPQEADDYLRSEYRYWGEVVKRSGVGLG